MYSLSSWRWRYKLEGKNEERKKLTNVAIKTKNHTNFEIILYNDYGNHYEIEGLAKRYSHYWITKFIIGYISRPCIPYFVTDVRNRLDPSQNDVAINYAVTICQITVLLK
jgi:hypothetical protein